MRMNSAPSTFRARRRRPPCRLDGGVLGDVQGQRGLAHRRPGRDDDEIGGLQAAGHLVELRVVGGKPGDLLAAGVELVERAEGALTMEGMSLKPGPRRFSES